MTGRVTRAVTVGIALAIGLLGSVRIAAAQPKKAPASTADEGGPKLKRPGKDAPKEPKVFDFTGVDLSGSNRSPQLLYFLERANEELERASLERRSFIPHMVRSLDEEAL
jgi:hypothetical protein